MRIYQHIDWPLLRAQKAGLLRVIEHEELAPVDKQCLEGILSLIDKIQDDADDRGYTNVFENDVRDEDGDIELDNGG